MTRRETADAHHEGARERYPDVRGGSKGDRGCAGRWRLFLGQKRK